MKTLHGIAVERDGRFSANSDLTEEARRIAERMGRCSYMISMHQEGIALNARRMVALQAELRRLRSGR